MSQAGKTYGEKMDAAIRGVIADMNGSGLRFGVLPSQMDTIARAIGILDQQSTYFADALARTQRVLAFLKDAADGNAIALEGALLELGLVVEACRDCRAEFKASIARRYRCAKCFGKWIEEKGEEMERRSGYDAEGSDGND